MPWYGKAQLENSSLITTFPYMQVHYIEPDQAPKTAHKSNNVILEMFLSNGFSD